MNRINSLYITNNYNATVYKRKDTKAIVSNPNVQNSRNDGIAALANYNRYENLKITPKLNIPILSPILISDSSCITNGEKIFDASKKETIVKQKDNNGEKIYTYELNGSYTYEEYDAEGNLLFCQSKNIQPDGEYLKIIKERKNFDNIEGIQTLYKNGKLEYASKYKIPPKTSEKGYPYEDIGYYPNDNTYHIEKCDENNNKIEKTFDTNLKPVD